MAPLSRVKSSDRIPVSIRIALLYLIAGALWILLSDKMAEVIFHDPEALTQVSIFKGWGFVLVTAFMLHLLIHRWTTRVELSEAKYREIVERANSIILRMDHTGNLTYLNDFALRFFGYSEDEVIGGNVSDLFFPPTRANDRVPGSMLEDIALNPDRPNSNVTENMLRNGGRVWIAWTGKPALDENGRVAEILWVGNDITEKRKAGEALRERQETFRRLFEDSADSLLLFEGGRCIDCNPAAIKLFGYEKELLLGAPFWRLSPPTQPDDARSIDKASEMIELARQIGHRKFDWVHRKGDGSDFHASIMLTWITLHGRELLHATVRDITDRKQSEKALFEQYELQRVLLSTIPAYVYIKDMNSVYMAANKEFAAMVGTPENEIPGKTDYDFFPKAVADSFLKEDAQVITTGEAMLDYEESGKDAEGKDVWFQTSKCPFYAPSGEIAGLVGICINTTDKKRAVEDRLQMQQRLQQVQKAESLARMGGAIAHHFNNILGIVIGNLELAMLDLPPASANQETITEAMTASKRAVELSRLMLTYLGQDIGAPSPLNLAEVCRGSLAMLNALAPENVRIQEELPTDETTIKADVSRVRQILGNLVLNAVEALGDRGGDITLSAYVIPAAKIPSSPVYPLTWAPKDVDYACISVSDTGPGMSADTFEKIFDPFFSTKFTGRGLGLAVVLGIVTAYDGAISVESSIGKGSVFKVFLPLLKKESLLPKKTGPADIEPSKSRGLILLVEDEPQIRTMAKRMLEHLEYKVMTAGDGLEALRIFRDHPENIRCVVMDVTMPGMDGWETMVALRAVRPDLPIIIATGHRETDIVQKDHPAQPQAFLFKPYQMKDMQAAIDAATGHAPPHSGGTVR